MNSATDMARRPADSDWHIDALSVQASFNRAARRGAYHAWPLPEEIARRMAGRMDFVRLDARWIADIGCGAMPASWSLGERYANADFLCIDISLDALRGASRSGSFWQRTRRALGFKHSMFAGADMRALPIADASVDLVWSNLALASVSEPDLALREFCRVLKVGGLLMFSTYGPDTLKELRAAFAAADDQPHVHRFIDLHDLGDLLVSNGFVSPVMDMDRVVYTYADVDAMILDLRQSGQTNSLSRRRRGLTGRSLWGRMRAAYPRRAGENQIEATFEIVYGHAWKGQPIVRMKSTAKTPATISWMPGGKSAL